MDSSPAHKFSCSPDLRASEDQTESSSDTRITMSDEHADYEVTWSEENSGGSKNSPSYGSTLALSKRDSDASSSDTSSNNSGQQSWTRDQKLTAITMALMNFSTQVSFAVIAPFYPVEAAKKGATSTEIGLIFGIFQLIIFITSPIYGQSVSNPFYLFLLHPLCIMLWLVIYVIHCHSGSASEYSRSAVDHSLFCWSPNSML